MTNMIAIGRIHPPGVLDGRRAMCMSNGFQHEENWRYALVHPCHKRPHPVRDLRLVRKEQGEQHRDEDRQRDRHCNPNPKAPRPSALVHTHNVHNVHTEVRSSGKA